jgi:predicted permease
MHAFRLALRQFAQHRSFTAVTVLVLGLGIGASVTVYSIVDGVLLKPLPYAEPDRLVTLWATNHERGLSHEPLSPVNFMDYRELDAFADAAGWWRPDVNLADPGMDPVRVNTIETGANLMAVLGVAPQLGPGFPADEPYFVAQPLFAVISDRLWRSRYGADPGLIGRHLQLSGTPYVVVGVMPPGFDFPGGIDVWQRSRWDFTQHSRAAHFMEAVARLAPGETLETADAAVTGLARRLENDFANTNRAWSVRLVPLLDEQLGYYRPALVVLFGAVALLLLIGCLNVASLLLTRALSREREIAVRTALGASPRHLVVQLLAESLVLSLGGAVVGTLAAVIALPVIVATAPVDVPRLDEAAINIRAMGFALAAAAGATLLFGLVPAFTLIRRSLSADLKAGERGSSRASRTVYRLLVVGEVALAMALLVGSGLLVSTVGRMTTVPLGVGNGDVVTTSVQLSGLAYPDWTNVSVSYQAILDELRRQPGVRAAGAANFLPLDAGWRIPFGIEGELPDQAADLPQAQFHSVSDGYFEAIGATLASGRFFNSFDRPGSTGAVVVNRTFADRFLRTARAGQPVLLTSASGIGPLGASLMPREPIPFGGQPVRVGRFDIVGIVDDVRNVPLGQPVEPAVYFAAQQFPFRSMFVAIDAPDAPTAVSALRNALRTAAPGVPLTEAQTWNDLFRRRTGEPRLLMTVLVFFGALAAILAAMGIYGLFSWMVTLRRRELAIRLTLGARPAAIGARVLRQGLVLVVLGFAAGWVLVRLADAALAQVLFEVRANDPVALVGAALLLLASAALACLPPALRAMRVDPVEGLRE